MSTEAMMVELLQRVLMWLVVGAASSVAALALIGLAYVIPDLLCCLASRVFGRGRK
ncbi:hypothetical protein [Chitinolyticbacter meiyuanensis]|uniref:hypothetical protein n=1 Tax=Chitinolyticbacter meiyuanensis TaxID=682798 RepID=UPI0016525D58|nr:hypothetical protein [Chitinolyticbacter meiyuanensis]